MNIADWIALAIILFLLICAVRYIFVSRKKNGCCGCCSECSRCKKSQSKQKQTCSVLRRLSDRNDERRFL